MHFLHYVAASSLALLATAIAEPTDYHEQLKVKPLPQSALLASFNFRSNTSLAEFEAHNFRYFPRSLGQILQHVGTRELHLRFSLGRWDAASWGARPWDGTKEGGTGVELWAWLEAETDEEADNKWLTLTNALSGLFCASLNFIDSTRTTRPVMSFKPEGQHPNMTAGNMHLLHGVLPKEVVCTENLTPFLKLLPCKGKVGISTLLDGHKLFDASWQSMAIDVRPLCPRSGEEDGCVLQIEQTIDMVLDIERSKRPRDNPIPRPLPAEDLQCNTSKEYHADDTCFPTDLVVPQAWKLSEIFGKSMHGFCPLADPDTPPVCIVAPPSRDVYTAGAIYEISIPDGDERCYTVQENEDFEIVLPHMQREGEGAKTDADEHLAPAVPLLYADRSFTGHGQERGGVQTILTNPSPDRTVEFVYMESLPWFMRIYLHTLAARVSPLTGSDAGEALSRDDRKDELVHEVYYRPFLDRHRGTQLELRMSIPPASTVFLTYDFEKSILRYTEYPPDANRGFDVAAAVITILDSEDDSPSSARRTISNLRTTSLLLNLPTPDFSMPYNVIIFTSTCIALAFGGLYNILIRRFVAVDEGPDVGLALVRRKLLERLAVLKTRLGKNTGANGRAEPRAEGEKTTASGKAT